MKLGLSQTYILVADLQIISFRRDENAASEGNFHNIKSNPIKPSRFSNPLATPQSSFEKANIALTLFIFLDMALASNTCLVGEPVQGRSTSGQTHVLANAPYMSSIPTLFVLNSQSTNQDVLHSPVRPFSFSTSSQPSRLQHVGLHCVCLGD